MTLDLISSDFRHSHDLNNQAGPTSKVLSTLTSARVRIILFPSETSLFPALVDGVDEVLAEGGVEFLGSGFVRSCC